MSALHPFSRAGFSQGIVSLFLLDAASVPAA
jgi:hypothetical protein